AFNRGVQEGLVKVLREGVRLYNTERDYAGCYRVYRGSLLSLRPLLVQHPDLQQAIDAGLAKADGLPRMYQRAHALREVIDTVYRKMGTGGVAPGPDGKTPVVGKKSLWERLGGEENVAKVIDDFVAAAAGDPKVDFFRDGK